MTWETWEWLQSLFGAASTNESSRFLRHFNFVRLLSVRLRRVGIAYHSRIKMSLLLCFAVHSHQKLYRASFGSTIAASLPSLECIFYSGGRISSSGIISNSATQPLLSLLSLLPLARRKSDALKVNLREYFAPQCLECLGGMGCCRSWAERVTCDSGRESERLKLNKITLIFSLFLVKK